LRKRAEPESTSSPRARQLLLSIAAFVYEFVAPTVYARHQKVIDANWKKLPKIF
jgi:hypothetical protein